MQYGSLSTYFAKEIYKAMNEREIECNEQNMKKVMHSACKQKDTLLNLIFEKIDNLKGILASSNISNETEIDKTGETTESKLE